MSNPIKLKQDDTAGGNRVNTFPLCRRHREELTALSDDAEILKRSLAEILAGTVVLDRRNVVNLWVVKFVMRSRSVSFRAKEALAAGEADGSEWVTVNANTTLRHLLKEYGDRLLGYDSARDELTLEVLSYDIVDSSVGTVRVLVRKEAK